LMGPLEVVLYQPLAKGPVKLLDIQNEVIQLKKFFS